MLKKLAHAAIGILFVATTACSTQTAYITMPNAEDGVKLSTAPMNGQSLGMIKGEDGGAIWDKCDEKAQGSIRELAHSARRIGANAVGNIMWTATHSNDPSCKKGWGYLAIWPFILTPLFMSTQVTGTAYKIAGGAVNAKKHGLFVVPQTPVEEAAFVKAVLAARQ